MRLKAAEPGSQRILLAFSGQQAEIEWRAGEDSNLRPLHPEINRIPRYLVDKANNAPSRNPACVTFALPINSYQEAGLPHGAFFRYTGVDFRGRLGCI
jgi:hypothetical protein